MYRDKLINIVVSGTQKRDYFATIRKTFNDIHDSFEKLGVVELVPLPDYPEYEIEYQELIGYEKARKDEYFAGKLGKSYSVSTLLNGIEKPEDRRKEGDNYYVHGNLFRGDNTMIGENRTITAQNYIEGNVSGGNIAGRDINIQNNTSMTKEEFLKLLQTLKEDLPNSSLPADELDAINGDIQSVEDQLKKDKPSKSIVTRKLESVNGVLEDAGQVIETVEKGKEVFDKVVDTVKILVSAISTASFLL